MLYEALFIRCAPNRKPDYKTRRCNSLPGCDSWVPQDLRPHNKPLRRIVHQHRPIICQPWARGFSHVPGNFDHRSSQPDLPLLSSEFGYLYHSVLFSCDTHEYIPVLPGMLPRSTPSFPNP
ncbi:hypothetical protein TGPRC2_365340 [Toxoplasma gondii TgCatPRC2]|uniref:Uncharacterized protein n=2 Tax=Toxoplasma gondii TaxID=5811 RepID=A0A151H4P1_TOXGO|nr:hypothetical protein TGDOM2_365340 [Toxoplasma gondii GAB2-2007-GAL-DOM2]KYK64317.1 hypothetical protein TGPRC2_365340 [Toxoplasma gondii TgCatPRC2]